jgi:Tetratricopeptide repeat
MLRNLAAALLVLGLAVPTQAAELDSELNQPYSLRVALRIALHRDFTPVFKKQLQRELRESLQAAFGALADVEVLDMTRPDVLAADPLLKRVAEQGLQQGLEGAQPLSRHKTHFVLLDYVNGLYDIQARQLDGLTGLASATVRHEQTADRQLVARTAALLVNQDFGLVGTIRNVQGNRAELAIKGGGLGVPLTPWLKKDEVFAIMAIHGGGRPTADRVPWALVRAAADPQNGVCPVHIFRRYDYGNGALAGGGNIAGFRCLKLSTTEATPRLLIVDEKTRTPRPGLTVVVSPDGFQDKGESTAVRPDGLVKLDSRYKHMAFVQVKSGVMTVARLPVEIVDGRTILCPVEVTKEGEQRGQLELRRRRWLDHAGDELLEETALTKELNALAGKDRAQTIEKARAGLDSMRKKIDTLRDEERDLQEAAGKQPIDLAEGRRRIEELQGRSTRLAQWIKQLEDVEKLEKDPKHQELKAKVVRAQGLEEQADFEQAIRLYEQVINEGGDDPAVRTRLAQLQKQWATNNDEHRKARDFIYNIWPKPKNPQKLKAELEEARKALAVCRKEGDRLAPQKLLLATNAHALKLGQDSKALRDDNDDDLRVLKLIDQLVPELKELVEQVKEYGQSGKEPGKEPTK